MSPRYEQFIRVDFLKNNNNHNNIPKMTIMTRCKNVKYYFYYCDDDDGIMMIMIILLNFESISRISFIITADHKIMVYKYPMS